MSRKPLKCVVYHGETCLGDVEVTPSISNPNPNPNPNPFKNHHQIFPNNKIRITQLSLPGERCPPISVLQTISPFSVRCKIQAKFAMPDSPITLLYLTCFQEYRSAVVVVSGAEELHLVAMPSKVEKSPCFWCFSVKPGLYGPCLGMLNLRCLAIVFDLDETLIVANSMKSFEDRIEALSRRIDGENDPMRVSGMSAELKRYIEDKKMLKQYIENDTVLDNGSLVAAQNEIVRGKDNVFRPVVRLQEKNIVLTRINPEIRDTSVFVRLRPAWEDLKSYLTAKGRKRFEVYVCTMAERDYALEIWRLLDPEANLINFNQLVDRVVCVKPGSRKSLQHVFQDGACHPKMAMVIDDRLNVWDNKDQPRVHVVPAFTPYYAPQAEMATAVPVLCVARNVACNVRGGFFKEFDENLMRRIFELQYENDMSDLPHSPDVSNYLMAEIDYQDTGAIQNNTKDVPMPEGMTGSEVEQRLNQSVSFGQEGRIQDRAQAQSLDDDSSLNGTSMINKGSSNSPPSSLFISVLHEIGRRCESKVEFRPIVGSSKDLLFSFEVLFSTERIGTGTGRTKIEAQLQAAENALRNLESNYISFIAPNNGVVIREKDKLSTGNENGFLGHVVKPASDEPSYQDYLHGSKRPEQSGQQYNSERLSSIMSVIQELCMEGQNLVFQDRAPATVTLDRGKYYFQVELAGRVLGKGIGSSREEAKFQAAEEALKTLRNANGTIEQKC